MTEPQPVAPIAEENPAVGTCRECGEPIDMDVHDEQCVLGDMAAKIIHHVGGQPECKEFVELLLGKFADSRATAELAEARRQLAEIKEYCSGLEKDAATMAMQWNEEAAGKLELHAVKELTRQLAEMKAALRKSNELLKVRAEQGFDKWREAVATNDRLLGDGS